MSEIADKKRPMKCFIVDDDDEHHRVMFSTSDIAAKRWFANSVGLDLSDVRCRRKREWDGYAETGVPALVRIADGWQYECEGCGTSIEDEFIGTRERSHDGYEEWELTKEYGPDLTRPPMTPVEPKQGHVWCHQNCYEADIAARRTRRRWEERVHAWMARRLKARLPEAVVYPLPEADPGQCSVHGSYASESYVYVSSGKRVYFRKLGWHTVSSRAIGWHQVSEAIIRFEWPGAKYGPASFRACDERYIGKPRRAEIYVANGDKDAFEAWAEQQRRGSEMAP